MTAPGGVAALDRGMHLLAAFSERDTSLSLSELSERSCLVPSTVSRLLQSLLFFEFVQRASANRYQLGPAVARLYGLYLRSFSLEALVLPVLQQLASQTRESASFHVRQGDHRLVLYRVNSSHLLSDQTREGELLPLHAGSGGHVLLAFGAEPGPRYDRIRKDGYMAAPVSDRAPELAGVSAPVFDVRHVVGALTLTLPSQRWNAAHIETVCAAAAALSRQLGGSARLAGAS